MKFEAKPMDFPFVETLTKRERAEFKNVADKFAEIQQVVKSFGALIPISFAAKVLGVSRSRAYQFVDDKRLEVHEIDGREYVTSASVNALALTERKSGRPFEQPKTLTAAVKAGWDVGMEK